MDINIFCPNCSSKVARDVFVEANEPREYYCQDCETSFFLSLVDEGEPTTSKAHEGALLDLTVNNGENFTWKKLDENLKPLLSCVLCTKEIYTSKEEPELKKCRSCGAILQITLEQV